MNDVQPRPGDRARPLVAVICAVPLLTEAIRGSLDFADVQAFAADNGDAAGLLRWLKPDAAIVDSDDGARDAARFARGSGLPLLHISVRDESLRLLRDGAWETVSNGEGPTPEEVRNVIAGALFSRQEVGA
jgi:hypothetical protein